MPDDLRTAPGWPAGQGEMAALIRARDWAATPLGPVGGWPQSLRTAVDLLLPGGFPMVALWGPELAQIYNDAYRALMGVKHPAGLGQPTRECWPEVWHINEPIYRRVLSGETVTRKDALYPLARRGGAPEDAWFTLSYSPLRDEAGAVAGVLATVVETTARRMAEVRRRDAEVALRESEARFRALVNATSYAVYSMGPDWTEMRRLDGRGFLADTEGPSGGWLDEYIHPDDQPRVLAAIREAIRTKSTFELEHRVRRADGSLGWTLSRAVPMPDGAGGIAEWFGAASDVTARRAAEEALRGSEARFRTLAEAIEDVFYMTDLDRGALLYLSPAYERVWGRPAAELRADLSAFPATLHPDDRAAFAAVKEAQGRGEPIVLEYRVVRPDGEVRWVLDRGFPVPGTPGRCAAGIASDITGRKRAEAALREGEARLRALVEGIPQLVWRAVGIGAWTWASPRWTAYTGRAEAGSRDHGWLQAIHPEDREAVLAAWRGAEAAGAFRAEHRLWHAGENRHRWVESQALPVRDAAGRVVEWLGTTTDVEELRRRHEQEILIAELQHRSRNLLAVVDGVAERTLAAGGSPEEFGAAFNRRLAALGRVQGLLSREVEPSVTVGELARMELAAHGAEAGDAAAASGRIRLRGPEAALPARAVQLLALALHELMTNALKHGALGARGGRLDVSWEERRGAGPGGATDGGARLLLVDWAETGVALGGHARPARRGFGLNLIETSLPYELDCETRFEFAEDGVRCSIALPLDDPEAAGG